MNGISRSLVIACLLSLGFPTPAASGDETYQVRITQIDTSAFPRVRIFVSVTDQDGQPISSEHKVKLAVLDAGRELVSQALSEGWDVATVLVIDRSGSMAEEIGAAQEAAKAYVEKATPSYQMAVLSFSNVPELVQGFTRDKRLLRLGIERITTGGETALQDALGSALDLLAGRGGRKSIVLLTDGRENASVRYLKEGGRSALLLRCSLEEATISIIGLGQDVEEGYLRELTARGGRYLFAPQAKELQAAFLSEAERLNTEHVLEVVSPSSRADGLREHLQVRLAVDGVPIEDRVDFVAPGVLPHVRGSHAPYAAGLVLLLLAPAATGKIRTLVQVARFRRRYLRRLVSGAAHLGQREVNSGEKLKAGDLILLCPGSGIPHFPRSWRLNRCRCMREPGCSGTFCYQQVLPRWLRRLLDTLSGGRTEETGRIWLCHCQGDKEGY